MSFQKGQKVVLMQMEGWEADFGGVLGATYYVRKNSDAVGHTYIGPESEKARGFYVDSAQIKLVSDTDQFYGPGKTYRDEVLRTCTPGFLSNFRLMLSNAGLGLAGEAGECADIAKKFLHHEAPDADKALFDATYREKMIKELGDLRWYLELAAHAIGVSTEEIERTNATKLRKRFPVGFNTADAKAKADEKGAA